MAQADAYLGLPARCRGIKLDTGHVMDTLRGGEAAGEEGFSLVEMLVVVVIMGILAAIAIPSFMKQRDAAIEAALISDLRNASLFQQMLIKEGEPAESLSDLEDAGFRWSEGIVEFEDLDIFDGEPEPCIQGRAVGRPDHVYSLRPSNNGNPQPGNCV